MTYITIANTIAIIMPISIYDPGNNLSNPILGVYAPVVDVVTRYAVLPPLVFISDLHDENTQLTIFAAIQLVIMQTITSFTLRNALNIPVIAPQSAPIAIPTIKASSQTANMPNLVEA